MRRLSMQKQPDLTFIKSCEEYICDCKSRNLRAGTIKHYEDSIKVLCHYIPAEMNISDISISTVNNLVITLREKNDINDVTLFTYVRDLKTLMRFFMRKEYIPTFKISLPKADKQPIICYSDSELALMLKKPDKKKCSFSEYKNWVIINFLLSTGIRRNSLVNIKIKDIDFDNEVVNINVTKNRKILIIPLNNTIVKILKEYLTLRCHKSEDEYLFCNVYGKQLTRSTVYHGLCEYTKSRGVITTGMHRFRHTFAKKWIMAGGNVVTLSKILGHSSLDITQNYINILISDLKQDINKFNILEEFEKQYIKINNKGTEKRTM